MNRLFLETIPYTAWGVLVLTFVLPCRIRNISKLLWTLFLLVALMMFRGFDTFGESIWRPELPEALVWTWCAAYFGSLLLACAAPVFAFWRSRAKAIALPAAAFGLAAWGVWNGIRIPGIREIEIADPALPAELDGYRIVQLADIHACGAARRWRTEAIVRKANALAADLVCLTGDQTDGTVSQRFDDIEPLSQLQAKDGVFAVTGNHEYFYDMTEWRPAYRRLGVRLLENECAFPRKALALGGINAFTAPPDEEPDTGCAFATATNEEYRVLLQHRPDPAKENFSRHRVNLQLSGHTHGGFMPGLFERIEKSHGGFLRGIYRVGGGHLIVSPGCGPWPGLPLRYCDPSEILLIVLRRPSGQ